MASEFPLTVTPVPIPGRSYWQAIYFRSRGGGVGLQLDGGAARIEAVQCGVHDPLPQELMVAEFAAYAETEISGIGVDETGGDAAAAPVAMNQGELWFSHFPGLANQLLKGSVVHTEVTTQVSRVVSVKVDYHLVVFLVRV